MVASNSVGFSWTEEKSSIFLETMTHLVISKKLDPLADGTIDMVLSKLVEFKDFTFFIFKKNTNHLGNCSKCQICPVQHLDGLCYPVF